VRIVNVAPAPFLRAAVSCLTAAALIAAQFPAAPAARAMTRAEYEACQARDEEGFRAAVEAITLAALERGVKDVDYGFLVSEEWRRGGLDEIVDRRVDQAIGEVREESSWLQLLSSLASKDKAQELATTVAERVYRSEPVKKALEGLAAGIGRDIGKRIETATLDTAQPATHCMQAFLGRRYGSTVARVVSESAGKEYIDPSKGGAQISTGQLLMEGSEGIAGTVVLLVRRQLSNMASRIGQRIIGSVLGRLVSVVAGGVGVVLIAKDIWDFRHGVLPIIAEEMKAKATKDKVREELARSIDEQIRENLKEISEKTADRVVEIWLKFRRAHAKVLELAEKHAGFRTFLDAVKATDLARLDEIVALVLEGEGEPAVLKRLDDGTLHYAVSSMPAAALDIAREARSLATGLKWAAVAGDGLSKVVEFGFYRRANPDTFTKASLQRLLALEDRLAITRLAGLEPAARVPLFELESDELKKLARALDEMQLDSLARYLTGLEKESAQRVLHAVALTPARMQELGRPSVREAILASRDQAAAVAMMLRTDTVLDPRLVLEHAQLVLDGRVSPLLLWEKHPLAVGAAGLLALLLLLTMRRLVSGRRHKFARNWPGDGRPGRY
jgi:hypothetical protein